MTRKARDLRVVVEASSGICGCGFAVVASAMPAVIRLLFRKAVISYQQRVISYTQSESAKRGA